MTGQSNSPKGEALLAERSRAEDALRELDPKRYERVEHWLDKELYRSLYDTAGLKGAPEHKAPVMDLLRARADVYRGRKSGAIVSDPRERDSSVYDAETGNEQMAQTIDACLFALGDGSDLPELQHWDDFMPTGFLPTETELTSRRREGE